MLNRTYGNGTVLNMVSASAENTDSGYDAINRVVEIQHNDSQGTRLSGFNYAYDKANNRRFELDQFTQMADVYEYDSAYRLVRAAYQVPANEPAIQALENNNNLHADVATVQAANDVSWLLDGAGNWANKQTLAPDSSDAVGYITTPMNEYSRIGPQAQQHDSNGNLTADGERFYHYDGRNRLVRVTTLAGNTVAYYQYDALNRRSKKAAANEVVQYHYFGKQILEERNALGQMQRQFVYGTGLDQVLQMKTAANDYYYHANSIGSIAAVSDKNGQVVERYNYTAYGETTVLNAQGDAIVKSSINNPYRFTARRFDAETGFYYYRARFYAPERGRFIQRDPIGYADGMGVYTYVGNNPINWVDPLGTERKCGGTPCVDSTPEAVREYYDGDGSPVHLGPDTQRKIEEAIRDSDRADNIRDGSSTNRFEGDNVPLDTEADLTTYHMGDTTFDYSTECSGGMCTTTYTVPGHDDGFYDPGCLAGTCSGEDGSGPNYELGGNPYPYVPITITENYPDPGGQ